MLSGTFEAKMDAKGRTFVPVKMRKDLGLTFMVTKWLDDCLAVYTMEKWNQVSAVLNAQPMAKSRETRRFFFSSAAEIELDKQGRMLVPQILREYAGLTGDIVIIGAGDWAEIWSAERWKAHNENEELKANIELAMEELGI